MATTLRTGFPRRLVRVPVVAFAMLFSTLSTALSAGGTFDARSNGPELEALFWQCDYAVSTRPVDLNEGVLCAELTQTLRDERFGGDFKAMLEWWQSNKQAEHAHLALRERAGL